MASAQITVPTVSVERQPSGSIPGGTIPISAAEAVYHVTVQAARAQSVVSFARPDVPTDSMRAAVSASALAWLGRIAPTPVHGIQLDPYGTVIARAHESTVAQQQFEARLATPGLSSQDRAYTYLTAIRTFASVDDSSQRAMAERYLVALDRMDPTAATQQFFAHRHLAGVYYQLGRASDVVRHGTAAIDCLARMEFPDRRAMYADDAGPPFYAELIDAAAGQPDAQTGIAKINATLIAATAPPSSLVTLDSSFVGQGRGYRMNAEAMITVGTRVGALAHEIVGNYWVNLPTPGATRGFDTLSVADGKIHVLELGHYSCPQCLATLGPLQRLQDRYPAIRVVFATSTEGSWGNRSVEPDTEAAVLTELYTNKLKIRFPISLWKGEKAATEDGGLQTATAGPNFDRYSMVGKPNVYVIDGHGRIRRVYVGNITREREAHIAKLIEFLQHESTPAGR